ncbi:MAG TPA: ATP-dependent DNA helicase PcrA [Fibrobacteres bacterium]|nr:ATP-dependent DNA helicase PcrA [Fibrobacterota bacterium]
MLSLINGLNKSQQQAVIHNKGPILVLAGAGSGKTKVLTNRIARLVQDKICKPDQILALTFTNKAAKEMQDRIAGLVPKKAALAMVVSTFHSLGARILRDDGEAIGVKKNFSILDDHQRITMLKEVIRMSGGKKLEDKHEEIGTAISMAKNASIDPEQYTIGENESPRFTRIYKSYKTVSLKRQTIDFDDLLLLPLRLFESNPEILEKYRSRFKFISIDEFQDTNAVQLKLARLLSAPLNNIMVVGDDDQGIYSWRGADLNNILSFPVHFPRCQTVVLDANYRSTRSILDGAMAVVSRNRKRTFKKITAAAGEGDLILVYKGEDEEEETDWISQTIRDNVEHSLYPLKDHALLMRTNAMMRRFEEGFLRNKIPYKVYGAMSFSDRKEVKDILAYLRFFANTSDELSFQRVLKVPDRGISSTTMEKLDDLAGSRRMGLWDAMLRHNDIDGQPVQHERCSAFISFYHLHAPHFAKGELSQTIRNILNECDYIHLLERASKDDNAAAMRTENVEEIIRGIEIYEKRVRTGAPTLSGYLQELMLTKNDESDDEPSSENGVKIMTLHKAKGLEFPVVFLCNMDDSVMPSPKAIAEGSIEEERRLFYVGMTRARKRLIITYPALKEFRKRSITVTPCRFIREIPEEFVDNEFTLQKEAEREQYAADFFEGMRKKFAEKGLTSTGPDGKAETAQNTSV